MSIKITKQDVIEAAADKGIPLLEAISMMQAMAVKMANESLLEQLCEIKSGIIFGNS